MGRRRAGQGQQLRRVGEAAFADVSAAVVEGASGGQGAQVRRHPLDGDEARALRLVEARNGGEQPLRIGMLGGAEYLRQFPALDDAAGVHHVDAVDVSGDHAEVVRDENDGHAEVALHLPDEFEDLRLNRHVERRGGLVGDEQFGVAAERHRNHHALPHAAGELVRIGAQPALRVRYADEREEFDGASGRGGGVPAKMDAHGLAQLAPDGQHGVERGHRLLKDHADLVAANAPHRLLVVGEEILPHKADGAAHDATGRAGDEAHNGEGRDALAAPALPDERERLALAQIERHAVHRLDDACGREEARAEIVDFEKDAHDGESLPERRAARGEGGGGYAPTSEGIQINAAGMGIRQAAQPYGGNRHSRVGGNPVGAQAPLLPYVSARHPA